jgi:DNA-binding CsgD family transcriptional regulator
VAIATPDPGVRLLGRSAECAALEQLVGTVRDGPSRALVLRGEAGVGKSALLDYLAAHAPGCTIARATGVESEMELAFAGLHQLCAPFLGHLDRLPGPQRDALSTAFGLRDGGVPDRFLVGLAVLSLLADAAEEQPLIAIVDDAQWLDAASEQALTFVARRLGAESVGLVLAVRRSADETPFDGLAELVVHGLDDADAQALLEAVVAGPLDERVRDRIVAETRGIPLALMELPRGRTASELAGGFGMAGGPALSGRIEERFLEQMAALPEPTRLLLLVAAAEPVGDPVLVWRAAAALGVQTGAGDPATAAGLVDVGAQVRFRHPLIRSAIYGRASPDDLQRVHRALAEATDPDADPDRRAWHRARATSGLDEDVAAELEHSAGRARARGGLAAGAAFQARAAELTPDPALRARRSLAAAQTKHQAGAADEALRLLAMAEAGPLDDLERARAQLLRAQITFATTRGGDAPLLLLAAAKRLEPLDATLARETYLDAFAAALSADRLARGGGAVDVAEAVRAADWAPSSRASDLLLDGLALLTIEGYAAGSPALKHALRAFRAAPLSEEEELRWLWLACHVARALGDDEAWDALTRRQVELARRAGAFAVLPVALGERFVVELLSGRIAAATGLSAEAEAVVEATGSRVILRTAIELAGWHGRDVEARTLIEARRQEVLRRGEGLWLVATEWGNAALFNGLGRYDEALAAAERAATESQVRLGVSTWLLADLVEAAVRSGHPERAVDAVERLSEIAAANGTEWSLALAARGRAMLREGDEAEGLYQEAVERLGRTRIRVALARTHLLYGEWLRRENRRVDAREQLRTAHDMLSEMEMEGFAERARRELQATGETVRKRSVETLDDLTPQEVQIARLAAGGETNPGIGAQLFLSPRTVEWHLRKVYSKLGVHSRRELAGALPGAASALVGA